MIIGYVWYINKIINFEKFKWKGEKKGLVIFFVYLKINEYVGINYLLVRDWL